MDTKPLYEAIKRRAYDARLPMYLLCRRAGVANSTLWRWDKYDLEPTILLIGKLERAMDDVESEIEARKQAA